MSSEHLLRVGDKVRVKGTVDPYKTGVVHSYTAEGEVNVKLNQPFNPILSYPLRELERTPPKRKYAPRKQYGKQRLERYDVPSDAAKIIEERVTDLVAKHFTSHANFSVLEVAMSAYSQGLIDAVQCGWKGKPEPEDHHERTDPREQD